MMQINIQQTRKNWVFLLLLTLIWVYIFIDSGIFDAGFNYFLDDHQIFLSHNQYTSFHDIFVQPFTSLFSPHPKYRFRPLYDVFLRLFSQLYGLNSFLWYLSSFLVAITTTWIFYIVARLQNFSYLESTIFAALIAFGQQASTYARFGTPETTSTFLLALAFLFASLKFNSKRIQLIADYLFLIFALFAALNKEACILMLPALAFFKVWNLSQKSNISLKESFWQNKNNIFFILGVFLLFMAYIKLAKVTGPGYAGIAQETFSIKNIGALLINFKPVILINIIYCIISFKNYRWNRCYLSGFYILSGLIILPQLILYSKSGMSMHYFLPVAIGSSLLIVYPLKKIRQKSNLYSQVLTFALVLVIFWGIYSEIIIIKRHFEDVSFRTGKLQEMMTDISQCIGENSSLIIFANPYTDYELIYAFKIVMDEIRKNNPLFLATYGSQNSNFKTDIMKQYEQKWLFLIPKELEKIYNYKTIKSLNEGELEQIKGIFISNSQTIEKELINFKLSWFKPDILTRKYYEGINFSFYCK